MKWEAVESSQIAEVGYDSQTSTLGIRFKKTKGNHHTVPAGQTWGSEYHYAGVSDDVYQALRTAESVGKYFGEHIKPFPAKYPFYKVEPVITEEVL